MAERIPFAYDPITRTRTFYEDVGGDDFVLHTEADVEGDLDHNKEKQNSDAWRYGGDFRLEAHIPDIIALKWFADYGIKAWDPEHQKAVVKKLNDPDWRYLKTFTGHIA